MKFRRPLGRIGCLVVLLTLIIGTLSGANANPCGGSHGEYTTVLCEADFMVGNGSYLVSPSGDIRMYMQGNVVTYDTTTNPYGVIYVMYSGTTANRLRAENGGFGIYTDDWTLLTYRYWSEDPAYVQLEEDGCLHSYLYDDTYLFTKCYF